MTSAYRTTSEPRIQDVTNQIEKIHRIYGASDYTAPHRYSSGKALNYATGSTIQKAEREKVTIIPYELNYVDEVGLFGAENHFVRLDLNIKGDVLLKCFEETFWECAKIGDRIPEELNWLAALIREAQPGEIDDNYLEARMTEAELRRTNSYVSVTLVNKKTGLECNDAWLDVRLYTQGREEHPYSKMYVKPNDSFYIGFHARNTRRLGYDVECVIGEEYIPYALIEDKRYIM